MDYDDPRYEGRPPLFVEVPTLLSRLHAERKLAEINARINDPAEDARINQLVLEEMEPALAEERRVLHRSALMAPHRRRS